jgi:hypothetical protein
MIMSVFLFLAGILVATVANFILMKDTDNDDDDYTYSNSGHGGQNLD